MAPQKHNWPATAARLRNDAASGEVNYYITEEKESSKANDSERCSEKKNENEDSEDEIKPRPADSRNVTTLLIEPPNLAENENDVTNELNDAEIDSNRGADITVPGISENGNSEEICWLEEGKTTFDLSQHPTLLKNSGASQTCK